MNSRGISMAAQPPRPLTRRAFLRQSSVAFAGAVLARECGAAASPALFTQYGIAAPLEQAAAMRVAGADYFVPRAADLLRPDLSDADFEAQRRLVAAAALPVLYCNVFLGRPDLHCTGPAANHDDVLAYASILFKRLQQVGGRYMAFGSGGARKIPEGWSKAQADEQFVRLLARMAPLAAERNLVIAVEQLRAAECNYLNHLGEVAEIVGKVDRPSVRVLADFYHMRNMGDAPEALKPAGPLLAVVEIAEKDQRTYPGVAGDDFRPYFAALRAAGFSGPITIEGNGTPDQIRPAFATIAAAVREISV